MRLAVLGAEDSWYVRDLLRAASGRCELQPAAFSAISVLQLGDAKAARVWSGETRLDQFDGLLVRTMPPGSLEQVVYRMDALATLETQGVVVRNSPKSLEAAVDKFLCNAKLATAGVRTPPTATCQTFEPAMDQFHRFGGDVVVKPIFGGEGRGMMRLNDEGLAHRVFRTLTQLNAVLYIQPFLEHQYDLRLLCIGERVLSMRRERGDDWRTNISQGGRAFPHTADPALQSLALRSCAAVGAEIAGVDIILDQNQDPVVIEVNAVPGWRALSRVAAVDVASVILDHLLEAARSAAAGGHSRRLDGSGSQLEARPQ